MMVIIAMLMDGVDGRVARALNAQSEFGKELDSLSDVISFGVAPAFIMYGVAFQELNQLTAWIITALFPICGALRFARFNVISGRRATLSACRFRLQAVCCYISACSRMILQ